MADLPYSSSKAGAGREKEIRDTLRSIGASAVGFMVDDDRDQILAQFRIGGREVSLPVTIGAYEKLWLKSNPCGPRTAAADHRRRARHQAEIASWAILADWVKATAAMIAGGMLSVDEAFLPHIITQSGGRVMECITDSTGTIPLLGKPKGEK